MPRLKGGMTWLTLTEFRKACTNERKIRKCQNWLIELPLYEICESSEMLVVAFFLAVLITWKAVIWWWPFSFLLLWNVDGKGWIYWYYQNFFYSYFFFLPSIFNVCLCVDIHGLHKTHKIMCRAAIKSDRFMTTQRVGLVVLTLFAS